MATPPAPAGSDGIIFDVDFEPPVHVVGFPPAVGPTTLPYDRPTYVWHGDPLIAYGPPGYGQSLNLSNYPGLQSDGDSVSFDMVPFPYANYGVAYTIAFDAFEEDASFFVAPIPNWGFRLSVTFRWDPDTGGTVHAGEFTSAPVIGSWELDVPLRVRMELSKAEKGYARIYLDGVLVHDVEGGWPPGLDLLKICFAHNDSQCSALVDDVLIWGSHSGPIPVEAASWAGIKAQHR
ncbi:MAG: hypothetical protein R3B81_14355 [bacterium]